MASITSSDYLKNHLEIIILKSLLDGEKFTAEISKNIQEKSNGTLNLKEATLSSHLKKFESSGYVSSYMQSTDNGTRRRYYSITKNGRKHLDKITSAWVKSTSAMGQIMSVSEKQMPTFENQTKLEPVTQKQQPTSLSSQFNFLTKKDSAVSGDDARENVTIFTEPKEDTALFLKNRKENNGLKESKNDAVFIEETSELSPLDVNLTFEKKNEEVESPSPLRIFAEPEVEEKTEEVKEAYNSLLLKEEEVNEEKNDAVFIEERIENDEETLKLADTNFYFTERNKYKAEPEEDLNFASASSDNNYFSSTTEAKKVEEIAIKSNYEIKTYSRLNEEIEVKTNFVKYNKLKFVQALMLFIIMSAEILGCYFVLKSKNLLVTNYGFVYIASAVLTFLLFACPTISFIANPYKKKQLNGKNGLFIMILAFLISIAFIYSLNIFVGMKSLAEVQFLSNWILPSILATNFIIYELLFILLKNFRTFKA